MLVKCKGCGNKVDKNQAYKVIVNGKNNYFCNEKEYQDIEKERLSRLKVFDLCKLIIGNTTNTILFKELNEIVKVHSYWKIYNYLSDNIKSLSQIMNKTFNNEYSKIKYFSTIIKNNLGDYEIQKQETNISVNTEIIEVRYNPKKRKKSLNDYMNEYLKGD